MNSGSFDLNLPAESNERTYTIDLNEIPNVESHCNDVNETPFDNSENQELYFPEVDDLEQIFEQMEEEEGGGGGGDDDDDDDDDDGELDGEGRDAQLDQFHAAGIYQKELYFDRIVG